MTSLVEQTKSQRKTFTIPTYIVKDLEVYTKKFGKKQSQIIALALEEFLQKANRNNRVRKRVNALESLVGFAPKGSLKSLDIKSLRANR